MPLILSLIRQGDLRIRGNPEHETVLVLGDTREGKSTLINYLIGNEL